MEKTENTTDYVAGGIDLGAGEITIITVIDTGTKKVTSYQIKSYLQLVEAVAAEVKAYNEAPTLPDWTKHSPPEGLRCAYPEANRDKKRIIELLMQILQEQQKLIYLTRLAGL